MRNQATSDRYLPLQVGRDEKIISLSDLAIALIGGFTVYTMLGHLEVTTNQSSALRPRDRSPTNQSSVFGSRDTFLANQRTVFTSDIPMCSRWKSSTYPSIRSLAFRNSSGGSRAWWDHVFYKSFSGKLTSDLYCSQIASSTTGDLIYPIGMECFSPVVRSVGCATCPYFPRSARYRTSARPRSCFSGPTHT